MPTEQNSNMLRIAVLVGTTRPGRRSRMVAEWVHTHATTHLDGRAVVEILDLAAVALPLLDEPVPAAIGDYAHPHTRRWAEQIQQFDGFVIVTTEYNHSMPAVLKNAIDFLYAEWNNKAAGFVSYGLHGGVRAVEHLRLTLAETKTATVRSQVALDLFSDFDIPDIAAPGTFRPRERHVPVLHRMLDELTEWSTALRSLRQATAQ